MFLPKIEKSHTTLCEANLMSSDKTYNNNNCCNQKLSTKLNKSVMDIATTTPILSKIPVWKALPLNKRSKSFCYATIEETLQKLNTNSVNINNNNNNNNSNLISKSMLRNRAVSYTALPRQQQQQVQQQPQQFHNRTTKSKPKLIKSKTELIEKTIKQKLTTTTAAEKITTTAQTEQKTTVGTLRSSGGLAKLRESRTNSDELLDKCLEKGQQILRKIESLGTQGATTTTTSTKAPETTKTINNGTLKGKKKCNVMNKKLPAEKVNNSIKLMVVDKKPVTRNNYSNLTTTPSPTRVSSLCELKYLAEKGRQNSDALSDDSGHISNEANDNHQQALLCESTLSPSTTIMDRAYLENFDENDTTSVAVNDKSASKVFKLMQKFEIKTSKVQSLNDNKMLNNHITAIKRNEQQQLQKQRQEEKGEKEFKEEEENLQEENDKEIKKNSNGICTSVKIAKVEPVHCIKTNIEIFPNYSKEVTTWFY